MKSYRAHLLAAIPELSDPNFFRSVVLIFHHDETGASGVILNRPAEVKLSEVWDQISENECKVDQHLHIGGPVEGPLMAVHGCASLSEIEILDGVYLSMGRENLDQIVLQTFRPFKFFSGYSGWTAEQLETEVRAGGWLSIEAKKDQIYGDCDELWKQVCDEVGRKIMLPSTDHSSPHDPSLN